MYPRTVLLCAAVVIALTTPATATSVAPFTLAETAQQADVIEHARVARVDVAWGRYLGELAIVTTLTLEKETVFKGKALGTLALFGGAVGQHSMTLIGQPTFKVGDEVFLFVEVKAQACPLVGVWHGVYRVDRRQVHKGKRRVVDVSRGDVVLGEDNERGMTAAAFSAELRSLLRRPTPEPTRIAPEAPPAEVPRAERRPAEPMRTRAPRRHAPRRHAPRDVYRREKGGRQ